MKKLRDKDIIIAAKILSAIFSPFYLPVVGMLVLFLFSYLSLLPWAYKIMVLLLVSCFTIFLPTTLIRLYRKFNGWTLLQFVSKERRVVPYLISSLCYLGGIYLMNIIHIPHFMSSILLAALAIQLICAVINLWWKISTHSAAIGGVIGAVMSFAIIFDFNPMWWLCLLILLSGAVGTSRIILHQHTVAQVTTGSVLGAICAFYITLFL